MAILVLVMMMFVVARPSLDEGPQRVGSKLGKHEQIRSVLTVSTSLVLLSSGVDTV